VASIIEAESGFNPCAISNQGAVGLMQIMPTTAGSDELARLTDPTRNLDLGTAYLRQLLDLYDGDLELTLAAYNAGPANVRRYGGLPPFRETRKYVERVLGTYVDHHREAWHDSGAAEELFGLAVPARG
jgi:soluble lytic murein transglycosylase-like protein